ncbi:hypothetical protein BDA96_08G106700 [Sorghum bicolor]|uniref:Secreted protein n=2 Tax=Sorghum bicolor TaxID=4558 RepID=A0A921QFD1_SORBI|nr:hypothetical protein BDA96_08G106700 [Sorghum bicolor]KXG23438.1 hypothetical protein SORBI_3008G095400 [Sorghum bicolor]
MIAGLHFRIFGAVLSAGVGGSACAAASRFSQNHKKSLPNASCRMRIRRPPTTGYTEKCTARSEIANAASEPRSLSTVTCWPVTETNCQ